MKRVASWAITALLLLPAAFGETPAASTSTTAAVPSATALWDGLMAGNERYVAGHLDYMHLDATREKWADHQNPRITVLSCSDSRVPPELVFDQSIGDLFVIRAAGSVADTFGLASIEYAIAHDYTRLIVVLGHEHCGAVKAALDHGAGGSTSLDALVDRIRESFGPEGCWNSKDEVCVEHSVNANAKASAANLLAHSQIVRDAVLSGKVRIVTAYYHAVSGRVEKE